MAKCNGYMLVKYARYILPNENDGASHYAPGRRIHICPNGKYANSLLKYYFNDIKSNCDYVIIKKDLRAGWFIYKTNGSIMMIAKMPFSSQKINDIML